MFYTRRKTIQSFKYTLIFAYTADLIFHPFGTGYDKSNKSKKGKEAVRKLNIHTDSPKEAYTLAVPSEVRMNATGIAHKVLVLQ